MDFIRRQRCQPGYQPLKHAFYGPVGLPNTQHHLLWARNNIIRLLQDADLILLALATHEPSFRILREDPREKHDIRCIICQMYGHAYKVCPGTCEELCDSAVLLLTSRRLCSHPGKLDAAFDSRQRGVYATSIDILRRMASPNWTRELPKAPTLSRSQGREKR